MARVTQLRAMDTCRLVPSRYPATGILDRVTALEDLPLVFELESWSNDRVSDELGILHRLPRGEWVTGRAMSSVVMAAYCHPRPGGGRFNPEDRGAWYAALDLDTAHAEVIYHRGVELAEIGVRDACLEMRLYHANFDAAFHDVRAGTPEYGTLHDPASYRASQAFARRLLKEGSNGVIYRSVRRAGGECLACFRPKLVKNVRAGAHFEYRWEGSGPPRVRRMKGRSGGFGEIDSLV